MTVAAIILAPHPDAALAAAGATSRLRRLVEVAWSGGAVPTVVVGSDPEGRLAAALAGAEANCVADPPAPADAVGAALAGLDEAARIVEATDAALLWPVTMAWVDPETVTSLIETHGADRTSLLRPTYAGEPGWPVLVPRDVLETWRSLPPTTPLTRAVGEAAVRLLDLGDPGTSLDATIPPEALPPYVGPPKPPADHVHEWGEAIAAEAGAGDPGPSTGTPEGPATSGEPSGGEVAP